MNRFLFGLCAVFILLTGQFAAAQSLAATMSDDERRADLAKIAVLDQKVMMPMRDGVRLATDIYRPKDIDGPIPVLFLRTPYNVAKLEDSALWFVHEGVKHGYAVVVQNERGKYFSEGEWAILGYPRTDGYDALSWIAGQDWSNGRIGTVGCSSSAEWQLALAAQNHPNHAAMAPMAAGAGIGRVGEFMEQGNWYRGGVHQLLFDIWLTGVQHLHRPTFPADLTQEELIRAARFYDLQPERPEIDWDKAVWHLPLTEFLENVKAPRGIQHIMIRRKPNDPAWFEGGLYHDDEDFGVPALWVNSWYDVSTGPNIALYQHIREHASDPEVRDNQFMIVFPTLHCSFFDMETPLIAGERNMGDATFDLAGAVFGWFDYWLKDERNRYLRRTPKVRYYAMGANEWRQAAQWPPQGAVQRTYYLDSAGKANSLFGDGRLTMQPPEQEDTDQFVYDPGNPVPSRGGQVCCTQDTIEGGSYDQSSLEARQDILVFTSEPLEQPLDVTGWVRATLYVSSDAKDTDFTVKLVDVYPEGRAYNVDESIQRVRYRDGYDREVFMQEGETYEITLGPMATSNVFAAGHRIRVEISSSDFPQYARNLNTGGNNFDETDWIVARNAVHHGGRYPSRIELPVLSD